MNQYLSRLARSRTCRTAVLVSALVTGLVAGYLGGVPTAPPVAMANCGATFSCGADGTATSSLTVSHTYKDEDTEQVYNVEPVDSDTWDVTARWLASSVFGIPAGCQCHELVTAYATVDVAWSDASQSWTATCTAGCNSSTGPIRGVSVCPAGGCGGNPPLVPFDHSWAYELILDIDHTFLFQSCPLGGVTNAYLSAVDYVANSLDDGDVIESDNCSHGQTVTPDMQNPVGATDNGGFECSFSCSAATGPTLDISYSE